MLGGPSSAEGEANGMTGCAVCADLATTFAIRSPTELSKALRVVCANLADGTLEECAAEVTDSSLDLPPLAQLPPEGPWPDVINYRVRCRTCRLAFELEAETYHGRGGTWRPVAG